MKASFPNPRVMTFDELTKELTLTAEELVVVYGKVDDKTHLHHQTSVSKAAAKLNEMGFTRELYLSTQFEVCNDEKTKVYALLVGFVTGQMPPELFGEYVRRDLSVVNFDDLYVAIRTHKRRLFFVMDFPAN